jgi:hypothetical protein
MQSFVAATTRLLIFVSQSTIEVLHKHVTHYDPRLGFLYYKLTPPPRGLSLSVTWGCAVQLWCVGLVPSGQHHHHHHHHLIEM